MQWVCSEWARGGQASGFFGTCGCAGGGAGDGRRDAGGTSVNRECETPPWGKRGGGGGRGGGVQPDATVLDASCPRGTLCRGKGAAWRGSGRPPPSKRRRRREGAAAGAAAALNPACYHKHGAARRPRLASPAAVAAAAASTRLGVLLGLLERFLPLPTRGQAAAPNRRATVGGALRRRPGGRPPRPRWGGRLPRRRRHRQAHDRHPRRRCGAGAVSSTRRCHRRCRGKGGRGTGVTVALVTVRGGGTAPLPQVGTRHAAGGTCRRRRLRRRRRPGGVCVTHMCLMRMPRAVTWVWRWGGLQDAPVAVTAAVARDTATAAVGAAGGICEHCPHARGSRRLTPPLPSPPPRTSGAAAGGGIATTDTNRRDGAHDVGRQRVVPRRGRGPCVSVREGPRPWHGGGRPRRRRRPVPTPPRRADGGVRIGTADGTAALQGGGGRQAAAHAQRTVRTRTATHCCGRPLDGDAVLLAAAAAGEVA